MSAVCPEASLSHTQEAARCGQVKNADFGANAALSAVRPDAETSDDAMVDGDSIRAAKANALATNSSEQLRLHGGAEPAVDTGDVASEGASSSSLNPALTLDDAPGLGADMDIGMTGMDSEAAEPWAHAEQTAGMDI
eukprot:COSAG01_NODE_10863_length_2066_cov_1.409761_3_plen_137_part_00